MNNIIKKILLFGFGGFAGDMLAASLQNHLQEKDIDIRKVEKKDYLTPLGLLASKAGTGKSAPATAAQIPGFEAAREYEGDELPVRFLLFVGFDSRELDEVLAVCRECGIGRNDLKAVLTPNNALWNAVSLCRELMEEHMAMNNRRPQR